MRELILLLVIVLTISGCSEPKTVFGYQNPIHEGLQTGIRDAQIFQDDDGKFYLMGTSAPFWPREGKSPGIKIYSSDSITGWEFEKLLIDRSELDSCGWYLDRFWAPEIHKLRGKYYLLFNSLNETYDCSPSKHLKGFVAVSDSILGEYKVLKDGKPLMNGNDLTFFEDDNGKIYAFNNGSGEIKGGELNLEKMEIIGTPEICFTVGDSAAGDWDHVGIEGAYVIKEKDTYYMFYSSWSRGYEIGYATAKHPLGPWSKFEGNPIYGAQSKAACKRFGSVYSGDPDSPWQAVGHNEVFTGPDGRRWISCHGILKGENQQPGLVIDPFEIIDGKIIIEGPTHEEQVIYY
ncbi:glycoside hydrolase family 43 protein [Thermophagus sp. OGC60D27]|uniref:glycoside hydrolase family 43 protein n=1 Tax=Thermophagus sp. OGC60D27 TaxID=3458415 RepID=UPI0040379830